MVAPPGFCFLAAVPGPSVPHPSDEDLSPGTPVPGYFRVSLRENLRERAPPNFIGRFASRVLQLAGDQFHLLERLRERRAQNAAFGDDGGDILAGRDIEGRVADTHAVGRELRAGMMRDLAG